MRAGEQKVLKEHGMDISESKKWQFTASEGVVGGDINQPRKEFLVTVDPLV